MSEREDQGTDLCPECDGSGVDWAECFWDEESGDEWFGSCPECDGTGKVVPAEDEA